MEQTTFFDVIFVFILFIFRTLVRRVMFSTVRTAKQQRHEWN